MRLFEGTEFDIPPRCERCDQLEAECQCQPLPSPLTPPGDQSVRVAVEQRKRGKTVTVVRGLADEPDQVARLLSTLKRKCGGGGTAKESYLEVQGDHADRIRQILSDIGYRVQ